MSFYVVAPGPRVLAPRPARSSQDSAQSMSSRNKSGRGYVAARRSWRPRSRRRNVEPVRALARAERGGRCGRDPRRNDMNRKEPPSMVSKLLIVAAAAGLLIGTTALGYAQSSAQNPSPGQRMQDRGSLPGHPGASGYAPGHEEKGSRPGQPGASGYAPSRQGPETTGRGSMGDRDPDRDRGDAR